MVILPARANSFAVASGWLIQTGGTDGVNLRAPTKRVIAGLDPAIDLPSQDAFS
jgi:hypothetical protein